MIVTAYRAGAACKQPACPSPVTSGQTDGKTAHELQLARAVNARCTFALSRSVSSYPEWELNPQNSWT